VWLRVATIAGVALAVTAAASAPQSSAATVPTEDGLTAAKKDFEGIKSARDAALLPRNGTPRLTLPELSSQAPAPAVVTSPKAPPSEVKPDNWLVEAMEKERKSRDTRKTDSRSRERASKLASGQGSSPSADEPRETREHKQEKNADVTSEPVVINPLTQYLGNWMTPQDYALLKPGLGRSFDPGAEARNSAVNAPVLGSTAAGLNDFGFRGGMSTSAIGAKAAHPENPYLESLNRESSIAPLVGNAKAPATRPGLPPVTAISPTITAPPPKPAPPTTVPEFAKPATDERYFKQLKRF
jgi:hypothetical protein